MKVSAPAIHGLANPPAIRAFGVTPSVAGSRKQSPPALATSCLSAGIHALESSSNGKLLLLNFAAQRMLILACN